MIMIHWKTGKPQKDGVYIVTCSDNSIDVTYHSKIYGWECDAIDIIAWYPIRDIKPYTKKLKQERR